MDKGAKIGLVVVLLVACMAILSGIGAIKLIEGQVFVTDGQIRMVQPSGILPDRDQQYAGGVNLPNSEANANNAEAHRADAQATAIVAYADSTLQETYSQGYLEGFSNTLLLQVCCSTLVVGLLIGALVVVSRKPPVIQ